MSATRLCECGCGQPAPIAQRTMSWRGVVKGESMRFVPGHWRKAVGATTTSRILSRCVRDGDCLVWTGSKTTHGYGRIRLNGRWLLVHRAVYEDTIGPTPSGMQVNHVRARGCTSNACCNVVHLEPLMAQENNLRSDSASSVNARRTHCRRGHAFGRPNARGKRVCAVCHRERARQWWRRTRCKPVAIQTATEHPPHRNGDEDERPQPTVN